ncbi:MAG: quinone-dependent dihydroorotate dehydrogenase [Desertifilum sp.]|nr:quinone-dependent dihydroorotate dehydrogenase [Desertifilum sp.]MDI9641787.1 quinone-dependent dihydroorotate dehydrogenase [Geitlerinema splendidum]
MFDPYQSLIRPLLFTGLKADPEALHHQVMRVLSWLDLNCDRAPDRAIQSALLQSFSEYDPRLTQSLWGLTFPNPVGLAAGFDKDGVAARIWHCLGFGFAELGTVTQHAQPGNPQPRLFRLVSDRAVLNRMGFNNQGAAAMALQFSRGDAGRERPIPLGVNLGKSKVTPLELAASDYVASFSTLQNWGDYFVVNVSSPNTPGLRSLQDAAQLERILDALQSVNNTQKPLFVKIAPDLETDAIADVIQLAQSYQLSGIIATNTTIRRDGLKAQILPQTGKPIVDEAGGISGAPLRDRSTEVIRLIWQQTQGQLPIIGVGGIFTPEDAWEKITAGASLVQIYTGWIYEGPWAIKRILLGLLQKLDEHHLSHISEAVGLSHREV